MCGGGGRKGAHWDMMLQRWEPGPPPYPLPTWFNSKISGLGQETRRLRV